MIPITSQMEMFPEFTVEEEEAMKALAEHLSQAADRLQRGSNGTRADDVQVSGNHYKDMAIQPWAVMEAVLTPEEFRGFLKGNIIKYSMRVGRKAGTDDTGKTKHYMQKLGEVTNGSNT